MNHFRLNPRLLAWIIAIGLFAWFVWKTFPDPSRNPFSASERAGATLGWEYPLSPDHRQPTETSAQHARMDDGAPCEDAGRGEKQSPEDVSHQ